MDGQVVEAGKPFKVPNPGGGTDLMLCSHGPTAPRPHGPGRADDQLRVHRGPHMKSWKVVAPGAKPFTELELKLDARRAALDKAAKEAGRRQE